MALRAKKPTVEPERFRALVYGAESSGKSHFACSIPNSYYIDTEDLQKYNKFKEMLIANDSVMVNLLNLSDIIEEIKSLIEDDHDYKTLIIDSISVPYNFLANLEVERLKAVSEKSIEGTEFSAHLNKSKRLVFHISMLLQRIDMNIIVISHEKGKYEGMKEIGKVYDINDKIAHGLGCVIHMQKRGNKRVGYIAKSRFDELPEFQSVEFDNPYEVLKEKFGEERFCRKIKNEVFASKDQLAELHHLIKILSVSDEAQQKWLVSAKCATFDELSEEQAQKYIDACKKKLTTKGE